MSSITRCVFVKSDKDSNPEVFGTNDQELYLELSSNSVDHVNKVVFESESPIYIIRVTGVSSIMKYYDFIIENNLTWSTADFDNYPLATQWMNRLSKKKTHRRTKAVFMMSPTRPTTDSIPYDFKIN